MKKPYTTLVLDDKYNQMQRQDSKIIPQNFELRSVKGLILDCGSYDFSWIKAMNEDQLPNLAYIMSQAGIFAVNLNNQGQTIIDQSTIELVVGKSKKFTGFRKGETAMLVIGQMINNELVTYWLAIITVK